MLEALRTAFTEGTGFADESSGIGRLLYGIDPDALESEITTDCWITEGEKLSLEGCVGASWSVSGDDGSAQTSYVVAVRQPAERRGRLTRDKGGDGRYCSLVRGQRRVNRCRD